MCKIIMDAGKNYEWFREHLPELVNNYDGKYIVIKNYAVIGSYDTFENAWTETLKREKAGTFIIQLCTEDETQTAQTYFTNMVSFS